MDETRLTLWKYYLYRMSISNGFYLPIGVIYLTEVKGFGLDTIGLILGLFSISLMAAEIPTGYIGDRVGRRASLAIGSGISALAMGLYVSLNSPIEYILLHMFWATGWAFRSGTTDAWLYELLDNTATERSFTAVQSRGNTLLLLTSSASALASGFLATINWGLPMLANAALSLTGILVLVTLPEIGAEQNRQGVFTLRDAVTALHIQTKRPEIRWIVVYSALFYGLFEVVRTFEQPAARAVGVPLPALGILYAGFKLTSAATASTTGWLYQRVGLKALFAGLIPLFAILFVSTAFAPILVLPLLFFNRSIRKVIRPVRNQYLNDHLDDVGRATILSGASMVLSIAAGGATFVGGLLASQLGILELIPLLGIIVPGIAALVWITTSPIRPVDESSPARDRTPS